MLPTDVEDTVKRALIEDLGPEGTTDVTSDLIDRTKNALATVFVREHAVLCGSHWFSEVFNQVSSDVQIEWHCQDGDRIKPDQTVCTVRGNAASILMAERTALNFLQTLSGTATATRNYVDAVAGYKTKILDTRKTVPGIRSAQKYAVRTGGGTNHRFGLYDAVIVKENHQYANLSIETVIDKLSNKRSTLKFIEVEIENLDQLKHAIKSNVDRVMLDNFTVDQIREAVRINDNQVQLEASGNITLDNVRQIAKTGVDFISIGAITKNLQAIDYSMLFVSK